MTSCAVTESLPYFGDVAYSVAVQPDGRIVIGGSARNDANTNLDFAVVRLNPDGSLDTSFGATDSASRSAFAMDISDSTAALIQGPEQADMNGRSESVMTTDRSASRSPIVSGTDSDALSYDDSTALLTGQSADHDAGSFHGFDNLLSPADQNDVSKMMSNLHGVDNAPGGPSA